MSARSIFRKILVVLTLAAPSCAFAQGASAADSEGVEAAPPFIAFDLGGRFLYDVVNIDAPDNVGIPGLGTRNEIRRARLALSGRIADTVAYKVEADFSGDFVELTDTYLAYGDGPLTVTFGQHNSFQSMEELTSSNNSSFIERAAFTDAFEFTRRLGLSAQYERGDWTVQGGVFLDDLTDRKNDDVALALRTFFAPASGELQLHFGASVHHKWRGDGNQNVRYRQRPLVHATDIRFINTGTLTEAARETRLGLEAAFIRGRLHGLAEAQWLKTDLISVPNAHFGGGAAEIGFYLSDDTRRYDGGVFKGVKVSDPVGKGGWGAWQINMRYDWLDLDDVGTGIVGGQQNGVVASLIWTPVDQIRLMINYGRLYYDNAAIPADTDRDYAVGVVGVRSQFTF